MPAHRKMAPGELPVAEEAEIDQRLVDAQLDDQEGDEHRHGERGDGTMRGEPKP